MVFNRGSERHFLMFKKTLGEHVPHGWFSGENYTPGQMT